MTHDNFEIERRERHVPAPIVIVTHEITAFNSVASAERYLEPFGVDQVLIYDRDGHALRPVLARKLMAKVVKLQPASGGFRSTEEWRKVLVMFLEQHEGQQRAMHARLTMPELVDRVTRYAAE